MFSLIITIAAIALVVALVAATMYSGGDVLTEGRATATAAAYEVQGGQMLGAMDIYAASNGHYPNSAQDLIADGQLSSIPGTSFVDANGVTQSPLWRIPSAGKPAVAISPVPLDACKAYNELQFGVAKVLTSPHTSQLSSCFGRDASNLTILKAKSSIALTAATTALSLGYGTVSSPLPSADSTDTSADGWLPDTAAAPTQEPAPPQSVAFISDTFSGSNNTLIHAHSPEVGGIWLRAYDLQNNYAYSDVNMSLFNSALGMADWYGGLDDHIILNAAIAPRADYEVSYDVKISPASAGRVELYIAARSAFDASGYPDGIFGYFYLDNGGFSSARIFGYATQSGGWVDIPDIKPTPGTHKVKLVVVGDLASMYWNDQLVTQRIVPGYGAGQVGFALTHTSNLDEVFIDNFLAK